MHLLAVVFRIALYLVIAVLIAVNFHFYMIKRSDEARARNTQAPVQDASTSDSSAIPSQPLPPVEPLKPQTGEIIITRYDHSALAIKARESFLKKDYKTSAALCRQLAEKDAGAFLCVGLSHFMLGDYAASLTSFEKALEGRADEFTCRKYLAFAYYYVSNFEKSLFNAEKAVGIKKDSELEAFHARLLREKQAHLNFISESTKHFKIEYDGYEHGGISRTVIGMLEDAYSTIGRDLDYYPSEPITVILYTNHDFHDVTQSPGWVGGFFDKRDGKIRVPVRGAVGKEALLRIILFHEYVHALIYSITKNCPL
jgi:tetratricopeptide (TPR) repeat protein